jgi:hypothetical protein
MKVKVYLLTINKMPEELLFKHVSDKQLDFVMPVHKLINETSLRLKRISTMGSFL